MRWMEAGCINNINEAIEEIEDQISLNASYLHHHGFIFGVYHYVMRRCHAWL